MKQFKVVVEKHPDGYVAYPLGLKGVVVGEGNTRGVPEGLRAELNLSARRSHG